MNYFPVTIKPKKSLLLEAWKPVSIGYKRRWWDYIALPDDVHPFDEGALRMEIKNFACTEEAEEITRLFLDALGDEYSVYCQGTAFFPLQSCMNHSCRPNAKAFKREEDKEKQVLRVLWVFYTDPDLNSVRRVVLEADGYQPYLISTKKGFRTLIKFVIELAKDPPRLHIDAVGLNFRNLQHCELFMASLTCVP
ncbi:predicted protein [Arabidopsis lyrata subsp. lyrata]|uniref:Predicted protein n=1 Tax=Arabidopsis lyrata subsp. lyrata TaxID=81972 RepID=D7M6W6_ARALL|nr:predicted protein [Arabidopsis lyrata subsp. lyrata]